MKKIILFSFAVLVAINIFWAGTALAAYDISIEKAVIHSDSPPYAALEVAVKVNADGQAVINMPVSLRLNGSGGQIISADSVNTGPDGKVKAVLSLPADPPASVTLVAGAGGDTAQNTISVPLLPSAYYGSIEDKNGKTVTSGKIQVYIGTMMAGEFTFANGFYGGPNIMDKKLVAAGGAQDSNKPVTFKTVISGQTYDASAGAEVKWQPADVRQVNLSLPSYASSGSGGSGSGGGGGPGAGTDAAGPEVVKFLPQKGAVDVSLGSEVRAIFSQDIGVVDLSGIYITDSLGNKIAEVSAVLEGREINIKHKALDHNVKYTVIIPEKTVKNPGTNLYNKEISWSFITIKDNAPSADKPRPGEAQPDKGFFDLPATHWAINVIKELNQKGIVGGYPDNTFKPENNVTRAEFAKMLVKALGLPEKTAAEATFNDVASSAWYFGVVETAAQKGLVKGYDNGIFQPDKLITREEIAAIMVRAAGKDTLAAGSAQEKTAFADDTGIAGWARGSVVISVKEKIINGYPDGTFGPRRNATRAEACAMIQRLLKIQHD